MSSDKVSAKDLPHTLTKNPTVIDSMKAIQRAAFWAFLIAILLPVMLFVGGPEDPGRGTYSLLVIALYLGYSSWQMNKLEGDNSITFMLLINTLLGLLMFGAILPLVLTAFSINALVKIGPYKRWHRAGFREVVID